MFRRARNLIRHLTGSGTAEERRTHPRYDTDVETICRPVSTDQVLNARIRNVSRSGLNLLVPCAVREGTMVRIDLPSGKSNHHTTVLACVMNAIEAPDGWSIGCMFSLELSDDEMSLFGGEKKLADVSDQRAWVRFPVRAKVELRELPGNNEVETAELLDISPAGCGLLMDRRAEAGTALSLALKHPGRPDRSLIACVVYASDRSDGKWAAGCQFLHEINDADVTDLTTSQANVSP